MNIALVLAGGTGSRLGANTPKQYLEVDNRMIISYCMETFLVSDYIDKIQIVADRNWHEIVGKEMDALESTTGKNKFCGFSDPGANRQLSIYNGLRDILEYADTEDKVMVHDGARPLLSETLIEKCFIAGEGHDGVMPVLPMKDTVYMSEDGKVVSKLLKRENIFAGQSPEVFVLGKYYDACEMLLPDRIMSINGSTEPAIMAGMDIAMVDGDENNFKITTTVDLEKFCNIIKSRTQ